MPYTPPATHSPGASRSETPASSRPQSCKPLPPQDLSLQTPTAKSGFPQPTSSYLHKHRRSPSVTNGIHSTENPSANGIVGATSVRRGRHEGNGSAVGEKARSLPPTRSVVTDPGMLSPPESSHTSSDDELSGGRRRSREVLNLAELQDAIRIIGQRRTSSPEPVSEKTQLAPITTHRSRPRADPSSEPSDETTGSAPRTPLSATARKISHSRSNTDCSALRDFTRNTLNASSRNSSDSDIEDGQDDEVRIKPVMVRKKSGELVRPALRPSYSKRRPSSMPGTPTYSKAVHFDPSLEHVRHFLQVDRPIAVSAGSSPVDSTLDDEAEFPFPNKTRWKSPPFEWEIRCPNFPPETDHRKSLPVRVEKVYLSSDNKTLMGAIAVKNLAFHKLVVARFTLDYWKTTSEVVADYSNDVRQTNAHDGYDRFVFSIKLEDLAHLEHKTLFFCVRYNVNGQEYWDNNGSFNYQVDFSKKAVAHNGRSGARGNQARPLHASWSMSSGRPRSMPISSDDFATCFPPYEFPSFHQSSAQMTGDSPLRFRSQPGREKTPDGSSPGADVFSQAFGNRYDFSVSLSAAIQAASNVSGDPAGSSREFKSAPAETMSFAQQPPVASATADGGPPVRGKSHPTGPDVGASGPIKPVPEALAGDKPALQSSSYHELLDKYCFFGSSRSTSQAAKAGPGQTGGCAAPMHEPDKADTPSLSSSASTPQGSPREVDAVKTPTKITSPMDSRAPSPVIGSRLGSRPASPVSFGYPYRQPMQNGFFAEMHTPTAIRGQ